MKPIFDLPELLTLNGNPFILGADHKYKKGIACYGGCEVGCCAGCDLGSGNGQDPIDPNG